MEIQRLHAMKSEKDLEIQKLSNVNKSNIEIENQMQYYINECERLQQIIKDNQEERDKLFQEDQQLKRDIQLMQMEINEKQREIDTLMEKQRIMEKNQTETLQEMKSHYELMRNSMIQKEIQELTMKFNGDKLLLENQIKILSSKNQELENNSSYLNKELDKFKKLKEQNYKDIEDLKLKMTTYELDKQKYKTECEAWEQQYKDLQNSNQMKFEELHNHYQREKKVELQ